MKTFVSNSLVIFSIAYALIITSLFSCNKKNCVAKKNPSCYCLEIYDPVCGCDGITYSNKCEAECAHIEVMYKGNCK